LPQTPLWDYSTPQALYVRSRDVEQTGRKGLCFGRPKLKIQAKSPDRGEDILAEKCHFPQCWIDFDSTLYLMPHNVSEDIEPRSVW